MPNLFFYPVYLIACCVGGKPLNVTIQRRVGNTLVVPCLNELGRREPSRRERSKSLSASPCVSILMRRRRHDLLLGDQFLVLIVGRRVCAAASAVVPPRLYILGRNSTRRVRSVALPNAPAGHAGGE